METMGVPASAEVTRQGTEAKAILKTDPASRIFYIDNLKAFLAVIVVLQHAAQPYGPGGGWWIAPEPQSTVDLIVLGFFMAVTMSFYMGLFFMISAYFVPASIERKGPVRFMKDRLVKLGVPIPIFLLGIFPVINYLLYYYGQQFIGNYLDYINIFSPVPRLDLGHLWYLELLLVFSAAYVAYRLVKKTKTGIKRAFPGNAAIVVFTIVMALASFVVRIWAPVNYWVPFHLFEPAHLAQYIMLFTAGIIAYREGWIEAIPEATQMLWQNIVYLMLILFPFTVIITREQIFTGGFTLASLIGSTWEAFMCVSMCITLLALFKNRFNSGGRIAKILANNSYSVYLVHVPIILLLQYLLIGVPADPLIKFAIVGTIGVPLSFAISHYGVRRLPYARYILG
jgi:peptidoglycan/LPS O-acetylase OafA/YrhL